MSTGIIYLEAYKNAELEAMYEQIKKTEGVVAEVSGKEDGLQGKPGSEMEYTVIYTNVLRTKIQSALDRSYQLHRPASSIAATADARKHQKQQVALLGIDAAAAKKKYEVLKVELDELRSASKKTISTKWRILTAAAFGLSEGALVFTILSESVPFSISLLLAAATAVATGWGIHLGAHFIRSARDSVTQVRRLLAILAIGFILSLAVGMWRANHFSAVNQMDAAVKLEHEEEVQRTYVAWPFITISFVVFIAALGFELRTWLSDHKRRQLQMLQLKHKQMKEANNAWRQLVARRVTTEEELRIGSASTIEQLEYAKSFEQRLVTLTAELRSIYEQVNVRYRTEGAPEFFGRLDDFGLKLYFTDLFTPKTDDNEKS